MRPVTDWHIPSGLSRKLNVQALGLLGASQKLVPEPLLIGGAVLNEAFRSIGYSAKQLPLQLRVETSVPRLFHETANDASQNLVVAVRES